MFPYDRVSHSRTGAIVVAVAICSAYFMAARLGLVFLAKPGLAVFWPAAGIAVGALIALGPNARLPVTVAVVVATVVANITIGRIASLSIVFGLVNAGQTLLLLGSSSAGSVAHSSSRTCSRYLGSWRRARLERPWPRPAQP